MQRIWFVLVILLLFLAGCQATAPEPLPTQAAVAILPPLVETVPPPQVPPTFTPPPATAVSGVVIINESASQFRQESDSPTATLFIPTNTPLVITNTPLATRFDANITVQPTLTPVIKPIDQYRPDEVIPYQAFPVPSGNTGWGMHWMPTVSQEPGVVDRFVAEVVRMHIKWVVFLNDGTNIGANDYLVERLVANGIMPVMRLYRSGILPYDGNLGAMVQHYRAKGVYYFQLYNEPNVNVENHQGFANPNQYALVWASAAREVIAHGGLPGIGALSPGGRYNHFDFLDRTLSAVVQNGDGNLLNHAWLSVHNYHGTRPLDDPGGFLLFRSYDEIVRGHLGRSLPIVGTEGGSYSTDKAVETNLIRWQYSYMRDAEPYFLAFSYWLLANQEGGGWDPAWEWQSLFKAGEVHPVVTQFFYANGR